jgi:hypothetical protein
MAQMISQKHTIDEFNGATGEQYTNQISDASDFTKVVENSIFASETADNLTQAPDNTETNLVGTAEVQIIGIGTNKKFKFKNLKGNQGVQGRSYNPRGVWDSAISYVNSSAIIDTVRFNGSTYYCKVNNTNHEPTIGDDNDYWGILALRGSNESVDIVQEMGTSTIALMSQKAVTDLVKTYTLSLGSTTLIESDILEIYINGCKVSDLKTTVMPINTNDIALKYGDKIQVRVMRNFAMPIPVININGIGQLTSDVTNSEYVFDKKLANPYIVTGNVAISFGGSGGMA